MEKLANPHKAVAVADFTSLKHEEAGNKIINLLDLKLAELRKDNDTVRGEELLLNQGEIRGLLQLKSYLERGK